MRCGDWYERWMDGLVPSLTRTPRSPPAESNRLETKVCGGQPYGFTDTPAKALLRVARSRVVTVALIRRNRDRPGEGQQAVPRPACHRGGIPHLVGLDSRAHEVPRGAAAPT
jgi:hypothetical protein